MISKVQSKELRHEATLAIRPKLLPTQRGMLRWVVLDPGDKVLEVGTRDGMMLEYLYRHMQCEVCGTSSKMEDVRQARSRLRYADIVFAYEHDIPWKEGSFDAVMLHKERYSSDNWQQALKEIFRVLRPGGQLIIGTAHCPAPFRQIASLFVAEEEDSQPMRLQSKAETLHMLQESGYEQLSWQQVDIRSGVAIGWKPAKESAEAKGGDEA